MNGGATAVEFAAQSIRDFLASRGAVQVSPPVLQPAGLYLELVGEEIRRTAILAQGDEWCLRPDMTIPVAQFALGLDSWSGAGFSLYYDGLVFRRSAGRESELRQTGMEWFSPQSRSPGHDLEAIATAIEACRQLGAPVCLRFGCANLIDLLLAAVRAPEVVARAVRRGVTTFAPPTNLGRLSALGEALAHLPPEKATDAVREVLQAAGVEAVGGRTIGDIAERLRSKALASETASDAAAAFQSVARMLQIAGPPDEAMAALDHAVRALPIPAGPRERIADLQKLWGLIRKEAAPHAATFETGFRRRLAYYDGITFDLSTPAGQPVGGGGRYDRALPALSAATCVRLPDNWGAVGFSIVPQFLLEGSL